MMARWLALPATLALAACGPIVQVGGNSPPPTELFTLSATPPTSVLVGTEPLQLAQAVTVDIPAVPGALQTVRIPVLVSDTSVQYLTGAQWSEQPNRLFQRVLADRISANGIAVIDQRSSGQIGGRRLTGQLLGFGVDVRNQQQVFIRYDATLTSAEGMRQRRFERTAPLEMVSGPAAARALNQLSNEISGDIALWVGKGA